MAAERKSQKTPEEFVNDIKTVLSASVSRSIQLMTRANDLINNTVQSVTSPDPQPVDNSEILERWLHLNVATYSVINDHVLSMLDRLITLGEGALAGEVPGAKGAGKLVDIEMSGRQEEKCSAGFMIQNHYDHALDIALEATPLIADDSAPLPSSHISFDPVSTTLEANEQKLMKVTTEISKQFVPGKTYVSNIHVIGYEAKELILTVHVLPGPATKPRAKRTKTRSAKKTTETAKKATRAPKKSKKTKKTAKKATRAPKKSAKKSAVKKKARKS